MSAQPSTTWHELATMVRVVPDPPDYGLLPAQIAARKAEEDNPLFAPERTYRVTYTLRGTWSRVVVARSEDEALEQADVLFDLDGGFESEIEVNDALAVVIGASEGPRTKDEAEKLLSEPIFGGSVPTYPPMVEQIGGERRP